MYFYQLLQSYVDFFENYHLYFLDSWTFNKGKNSFSWKEKDRYVKTVDLEWPSTNEQGCLPPLSLRPTALDRSARRTWKRDVSAVTWPATRALRRRALPGTFASRSITGNQNNARNQQTNGYRRHATNVLSIVVSRVTLILFAVSPVSITYQQYSPICMLP